MKGWIGVDLDGTLAHYDPGEPYNSKVVGPPIMPMVEKVRGWLKEGKDVRIFTARVAPPYMPDTLLEDVEQPIKEWCKKYIGQELSITCYKDYLMTELWDDRCVQVIPNTGLTLDEVWRAHFYYGGKPMGDIKGESGTGVV